MGIYENLVRHFLSYVKKTNRGGGVKGLIKNTILENKDLEVAWNCLIRILPFGTLPLVKYLSKSTENRSLQFKITTFHLPNNKIR